MICKNKGCSAFVIYKPGTNHGFSGRVAWKKFAYEKDQSHFKVNPACEGIWVRKNFPSPAPVDGFSWEFVPKMNLPH